MPKKIICEKIARIIKGKKKLEKELNVKLLIHGKEVEIEGEPEDEYVAEKVIDALEFGFPFSVAILIREEDYYSEYLDLIMNVRVVKDIDDAMEHIAKYSSAHSDAIVTKDYSKAMRFLREVDSSAVLINASTRLNDGFQFGLGAEIGISTDKIHARGPMGLEELTCTKFIVLGNGQLRE